MVGIVVVGTGLFAASASGQQHRRASEAARLKNPARASAESIAAGKRVYQRYCLFCHGDAAKGDGAMAPEDVTPSNLADAAWDCGSSDGEIFATIRDGVGPKFDMNAYKGRLTDQDIWNVVNYLRSIGPKAGTR
ncbi:MAG: hypothetical protein A3G76_04775 [Acidobacteria bacterium RIFCSPLOWO2_12_FULL_65_11]|nr:MAG: hypothetical protein A3H95_03210 [Acidobacteria bacterium RIFCSPLOWO2_02_FULL_64_15]OFW31298.1 MAG: hypothetical protein A3G76_04775 [Acidobacteria bacterium RIFCSPLOWO2_12_FULL_65_11]